MSDSLLTSSVVVRELHTNQDPDSNEVKLGLGDTQYDVHSHPSWDTEKEGIDRQQEPALDLRPVCP